MKYSDQQRIEKIRETTEKLLNYVQREQITPERICQEEPLQWTVTTPLYNIGEHVYNLSEEFKKAHPDIPGPRSPVCGIGWCITMRIPTGA